MKNLNLSIPTPCTQNWSCFTPSKAGALCSSCNQEVVDFTQMNDTQILEYFNKSAGQTCGRLGTHQLKIHSFPLSTTRTPSVKLIAAGLLALVLTGSGYNGMAHSVANTKKFEHKAQTSNASIILKTTEVDYSISGVIKTEDGELMPGVNVYLKDGEGGTVSDEEGKFEFPKKLKNGDVLIFSFIGYEKVEYVVSENSINPIEIIMVFETGIIMGKISVDEVYTGEPRAIQKIWFKIKNIF